MKRKLVIPTFIFLLACVVSIQASSVEYVQAYKKFVIAELNLGTNSDEIEIHKGISKAKIIGSSTTTSELPDSVIPPAGYVLATNEDFVFIPEENAPNIYDEGRGFFHYIGTDDYVYIPKEINGCTLKDYCGMFTGTAVIGVAGGNTDVTSMEGMFAGSQATIPDLSLLNTSSVTDMSSMFYGSQATSIDLSSFDTSNVTNMASMFDECQATSLDLSPFNTSNVTHMGFMFANSQATSLDLSSFDTSNVTEMHRMFYGSQATSLDLSPFNTSNVTTMQFMFMESQVASIDLSSFDTSNVTNMDAMFRDSQATTGYARNQAEADKFNSTLDKPASLTFIVK